ncbi:MAG: hypothetical protein ACE5FH_02405 [Candidatus Zixiibacteriota bacterium]
MIQAVLLVSAIASFLACSEKDVFTVSQRDEVFRYLADTEEGKELYRTGSLVTPEEYGLPFDTATYRDFQDSVIRVSSIAIEENRFVELSFGSFHFAEVLFTDVILGHSERIAGLDTTVIPFERVITRTAFLLKLGSNSQAFSGWQLHGYGYSSGPPLMNLRFEPSAGEILEVRGSNTVELDVDGSPRLFSFTPLTDIADFAQGAVLQITSTPRNTISYGVVASYETSAGFVTEGLAQLGKDIIDTIVTPDPNPKLWNLVVMHAFVKGVDSLPLWVRSWAVPYRVPQ